MLVVPATCEWSRMPRPAPAPMLQITAPYILCRGAKIPLQPTQQNQKNQNLRTRGLENPRTEHRYRAPSTHMELPTFV
jgi:hypothetical protein